VTTNATYVYDVVNRLTKITDSGNLAINYVYDAASKLTSKTLQNGVAATYTYDGLDRLTRLKDAKGNTVIADNQYSYNSASDITQNIDQSGTHGYGYDTIDRLTSATYTGTPDETYAYDGVGNRTSSHKSATYGYQPNNRLVSTSTASYIYNNNGNMISKTEGTGTTQFVWDFENRLIQVVTPSSGSVTYKYDALGRRIQRTPSSGVSTNFIYDRQEVVKDINSDGSTIEYLNGPGIDNKIRQKGSTSSTTYYFSQDHLGSTTALTGTTGKLVERETYDAYGNSAGSTRTRYGYTGRERDPLTTLLYYRARFYDAQLGRFISEDPIGLVGGINAYAYVENNPLRFADPSGLCPQNNEPCDVKISPFDVDQVAILMGEAFYPGAPLYTIATNTGKGNSSHEEAKHPEGYESNDDVSTEMEWMASTIRNRQNDTGATADEVANTKQANGNFQFEGYPNGLDALKNLGPNGGAVCEQARRAVRAVDRIRREGPVRTDIRNWHGVLQQDSKGPFVRVRNGATRIGGTDFW
jgi:RHS repeat-associated protein